ncbi:MAG: hypothetical protein SOT15_02180 [Treponema sp.]|nr:hypothetical protein [Treponema sp.]
MKALKKICTALMILAFAFVFASCSNGSDSDDDDVSSTNVLLPSSVGENVLAGKSYKYENEEKTKTTTYAFKDNTVTKTEVKSSQTGIEEYKYTYNANTGLLYLNLVSWTINGKKMTSMNEVYSYAVEEFGEEDAKEALGDDDMFKEITSMCYFVKDNGKILLGKYFADVKDVKYSKFVYEKNVARIRVNFDDNEIKVDNGDDLKIELNATEKTFSGEKIAGSYTVKTATKTLKELKGVQGLAPANGYITIKFSKLPNTLQTGSYNMTTGTGYEFIFDLDCDEYTKQ